MCNGWFLWQLSICSWAVLLVVSPTRGVIILVIKYIVRIDLPVCSTMTNMYRTFFMRTPGRTSILDFSSYLHSNPKEESLQLLQWRHITFYKPKGHSISVQPFGRATRHSLHYIKWCYQAFNFLEDPASFCSRLTRFRDINTAPKNSAPTTQTSGAWFITVYFYLFICFL